MKENKYSFIKIGLFFLFSFLAVPAVQAKSKTFTVVIDAGHGGKDIGAPGTIVNEKEINLKVALKLGELIKDGHEDVKVVYTRQSDRFVELDERANIANRNKADLFISIHTNAVKRGNTANGTETFTLGLARSDENLEVAKRENSVILLEDNYLQKYEGFDPNSTESYIIFEFMQTKHMEQSVQFASEIQRAFRTGKRVDRGVRQGGLLVLRKTGMPAVLVELGFITNREEERFMKSAEGQNLLARCLYNAFTRYKRDYDRKLGGQPSQVRPARELAVTDDDIREADAAGDWQTDNRKNEGRSSLRDNELQESAVSFSAEGKVVYKIQILTSGKKLPSQSRLLKGYKDVSYYREGGIYKYTYGETTDYNEILRLYRKTVKDFKDAFIIRYKGGEKIK
ncbi:N-acetylmuramoyl-L-alanine amidase [Parabacteroides sp. Marseille-P3160]|uniref:N-acetylmuramoyl-L-alanine amidase family protein n=1 Tax=Parabacteroides sp. Marseille-P3160 TaxID=1917887 RepID=UPI0009BA00F1|nr:N-acetylmuramoyl-L-alanine amidase [Parabacteroides sp. Marseille-P3160]